MEQSLLDKIYTQLNDSESEEIIRNVLNLFEEHYSDLLLENTSKLERCLDKNFVMAGAYIGRIEMLLELMYDIGISDEVIPDDVN